MSRVNSLSQYQTKSINQPHRTTVFSQSTATPVSRTSQISNIIQCPICMQSIRQSHMCPSCCKLFCQACIKNQIKSKKAECPSCLKPLNVSNLLNCSMLGKQIQQAISKSVSKIKAPLVSTSIMMSPSGTKILFPKFQGPIPQSSTTKISDSICQKHQLKLDYFCQQCNIGLCSDCAVLSNQHHGHRICKISQKKLKFKQSVSQIQKRLTNFKQKAKNQQQQANEKLKINKNSQNQKQIGLSKHLNLMYEKDLQKINSSLKQKEENFQLRLQNYEKFQQNLSQVSSVIQKLSKPKLVVNADRIQSQMMEITLKNSIQQLITQPIQSQSSIVPFYQQKTFILDNYNYLRYKGDVLVSQPLLYKGTQWRLKIFPGGTQSNANIKTINQYLSIHIQLTKGYEHSNLYRFRIQLVNQKNRTKCLSYQYENNFKQGSTWRIDNFIQIPTLYQQNFVNIQSGHVEIVLYVRCVTYYHLIKDQNQFINIKKMKMSQNQNKLRLLYKKAVAKGLNPQLGKKIQFDDKIAYNRSNKASSNSRAIDQFE